VWEKDWKTGMALKTARHWYDRLPWKPVKTAPNSNFAFEKLRIDKPVDMTGLLIGMTGTKTDKLVGR
jgi:hypothetical protein